METCLRTPIKETIDRHPAVGKILEEFGIGCVPCSVGTCLLGDVVEIHNLSPETERTLMTRVAAVVAPGRPVTLPGGATSRPARSRKHSYSPPVRRLVDEHKLIKRFLALVPAIAASVGVEDERDRRLLREAVAFIRSYADRFHHAKEEDILFSYFDADLDILKAMHEDHRRGRARVKELVDALDRRDRTGVAAALSGYAEVLEEHIKKEDEILYPWMDRNLSTRQVGEMFAKFREIDGKFLASLAGHAAFVGELEEKFMAQSAEVVR